jgi:hypothetical protein
MTNPNRQQSLAAARRACEWLRAIAFFDEELEDIECLIAEFRRLDANASRPKRKRIENPSPKTLAQRRWRDKKSRQA